MSTPEPEKQRRKEKPTQKPVRTQVDDVKALFIVEFQMMAHHLESEAICTYVASPEESLPLLRQAFDEFHARIREIQGSLKGPCVPCPDGWIDCGGPQRCKCCPPYTQFTIPTRAGH